MRQTLFVALIALMCSLSTCHTQAQTSSPKPGTSSPAFWDNVALQYEQKAHPVSELFAKQLLRRIVVNANTKVLDIATGTGAAAIVAAEHSRHVTAIDFSQGMLDRLNDRKIKNISSMQMNGQALEFGDETFDVSVSVFGVMLFDDWKQGLREMVRVTKRNGTCALAVCDGPNGVGINQVVLDVCRELKIALPNRPVPEGIQYLSDSTRLKSALEAAGLSDVQVDVVHEKISIRADLVFEANPIANLLTESQRAQVLRAMINRQSMSQSTSQNNGSELQFETAALIGIGVRR